MVLKAIIISFLAILCEFTQAPSLYESTKKRTDKVLRKHWPEKEFTLIRMSPEIAQDLELYKVIQDDQEPLAYILFAEAPSKVELFTYLIVFTADGHIDKVAVLLYKENYGGEIASKRFLRQFEGKANGQAMKFNQDIDGISGATISVQSIIHSIKKNSIMFSNLIQQHQ